MRRGSVFGSRLQHTLLTLQGLVRGQRTPPHEQQPRGRRMETPRLLTIQRYGRTAVLKGIADSMSGAQWRTSGTISGWFATPESPYLSRFCRIVAQVAHHINKYMKNNKINVYQGTLGFSCATCATCYVLFPIGKPKSTVAHCASVRHSKGVYREQEIQAGGTRRPRCSPSGATRHPACGTTRRPRRTRPHPRHRHAAPLEAQHRLRASWHRKGHRDFIPTRRSQRVPRNGAWVDAPAPGELVIVRPELVEKILAGETEAARILEPGYVGSVRRYRARWQEENRAAWQEYHQGQAARHRAVLESLIARHEGEAARLEATEPKGAP